MYNWTCNNNFFHLTKDIKMKVQTKTGYIHKGSYGAEYTADGEVIAKARVKSGKRGRPAKVEAPAFCTNITNDLFGRVPLTAPSGIKGRVVIGKASANAVYADDTEELVVDEVFSPFKTVNS
jgi:hypothetical protein